MPYIPTEGEATLLVETKHSNANGLSIPTHSAEADPGEGLRGLQASPLSSISLLFVDCL